MPGLIVNLGDLFTFLFKGNGVVDLRKREGVGETWRNVERRSCGQDGMYKRRIRKRERGKRKRKGEEGRGKMRVGGVGHIMH